MELGTPGCRELQPNISSPTGGLKTIILILLLTLFSPSASLTFSPTSSTTMIQLLPSLMLLFPNVASDPASFTMSAGLVDFRC